MPEANWMMIDVTDPSGHVEAEPRTVEIWDGGRAYRIIREDGSYEDWDGPLLRGLLVARGEEQAA